MNESTFAALRIVAFMVGADDKIRPEETQWFLQLIEKYKTSATQREVLRADVKNGGNVEEVYRHVVRSEDRAQLIQWLKTVMQLDREIHPKEKLIFDEVQAYNIANAKFYADSQAEYAKALLEADDSLILWGELKEAGEYFKRRVSPFGIRTYWTKAMPDNGYVIWGFVVFNILLALTLAILHFL